MHRVSAVFSGILLLTVTLALLPVEMIADRLNWPMARTLPVWWHRFALDRLGVRIAESGLPAPDRPLLITANHSSWLDICVLASRMPLSFVAKSEVASWPLFGLFARLQRCVFVERDRRARTGATTSQLADRLASGDAMVLFPEGTSSDGNGVLPFRSALLGAATATLGKTEDAVVWVQPVALRYRRLQGLPIGRFERPRVAWYGDMDLVPHLLAVFSLRALDVELIWGEPIPFDATTDRKRLAYELEQRVRAMMVAA
jgi:1-acyl-sn-glycerol-3-phosphate acyltransferase